MDGLGISRDKDLNPVYIPQLFWVSYFEFVKWEQEFLALGGYVRLNEIIMKKKLAHSRFFPLSSPYIFQRSFLYFSWIVIHFTKHFKTYSSVIIFLEHWNLCYLTKSSKGQTLVESLPKANQSEMQTVYLHW